MRVPNVPNDMKLTDKHGNISHVWMSFFTNLITQLNANLSDEGFVLPSQNTGNISTLNTNNNKSRILWNSTTEKAMINNNGTFVDIQT